MRYEAVVPDKARVAKVIAALITMGVKDPFERRTIPAKIVFTATEQELEQIKQIPGILSVAQLISEAPSGGQYRGIVNAT